MSFFSNLFDAVFAPSCAFDSHSSAHDSTFSSSTSNDSGSTFNTDSGDWTNNWGTQADYQMPAESGDLFSSNDWSSGCSGSSFGNDW